MRIASLILIAALSLCVTGGAGAANVLLPSDTNATAAPLPNLGVSPSQPATPAVKPAPAAQSSSATPQAATSQSAPSAGSDDQMSPDQKALATQLRNIENAKTPEEMQKYIDDVQNNIKDTSVLEKAMVRPTTTDYKAVNTRIAPGGGLAKQTLTSEDQSVAEMLMTGQAVAPPLTRVGQEMREYYAQEERKMQTPPTFLQEVAPSDAIDFNWTESFNVTINPAYLWGEEDIKTIVKLLGYNIKEIPYNCQLRMDTGLVTDKADIMQDKRLMSGDTADIKYGNKLTQITFKPKALCFVPKTPLPNSRGVITKSGDKYLLRLPTPASCAMQDRTFGTYKALEVQYMGDGKVNCMFK